MPHLTKTPYERRREFLRDLINLQRKHEIWLSHEDHQGAFILEMDPIANRSLSLEKWIKSAQTKEL